MTAVRSMLLSLLIAAPLAAQTPSTMPTMRPMLPGGPATLPALPSPDETDVRKAIEGYNAAVTSGDIRAITGFFVAGTPQQTTALNVAGKLTAAGRGAYAASLEKFGEAALKESRVEATSFPAGFPAMPLDAIDVRVSGDRAMLMPKGGDAGQSLAMKKTPAGWRLDADVFVPPMTDKQLAEQTKLLDTVVGAIDQTAGDIKAGHFRGPDEAVIVMNHRTQKAIAAAQRKMQEAEEAAAATRPAATQPTPLPAMK